MNSIDPNVNCRKNSSKWGGSSDIGGSPRGAPTKLTPKEIAQAGRDAFLKTSMAGKAIDFFYGVLLVGAIIGAASLCKFYFSSIFPIDNSSRARLLFVSDLSFFAALILFTALSLAIFSGTKWR